jgi:Flp pilus assembly protein TadD
MSPESVMAMPSSSQSAKKFLGFFSQAKNSKGGRKQSSIKIWVILLLSLISVAVFYWGLDYYLQLEEENQREIAQYDRKLQQDRVVIKETGQAKSPKRVESKAPKPSVNPNAESLKASKPVTESANVKKTQSKEEKPRSEDLTQSNAPALQVRKQSKSAVPTVSSSAMAQKASSAPKTTLPVNERKSKHLAPRKESLPQGTAQVQSAVNAKLKGYEALARGDYVEAQQWYQKAALQHPNDADVWLGLGASSLALGENEKARMFYQKALEIDPLNAEAKKAVLMLSPVQGAQWVSQVQSLLEQYPDDGDLFFMLGNYFSQQQDWVNAKNAYFKALSLKGENSALLLNLAVAEDHLGEYRSALQHYQKALSYGEHALNKMQLNAIKGRLITLDRFLKAQQSSAYEDEE